MVRFMEICQIILPTLNDYPANFCNESIHIWHFNLPYTTIKIKNVNECTYMFSRHFSSKGFFPKEGTWPRNVVRLYFDVHYGVMCPLHFVTLFNSHDDETLTKCIYTSRREIALRGEGGFFLLRVYSEWEERQRCKWQNCFSWMYAFASAQYLNRIRTFPKPGSNHCAQASLTQSVWSVASCP